MARCARPSRRGSSAQPDTHLRACRGRRGGLRGGLQTIAQRHGGFELRAQRRAQVAREDTQLGHHPCEEERSRVIAPDADSVEVRVPHRLAARLLDAVHVELGLVAVEDARVQVPRVRAARPTAQQALGLRRNLPRSIRGHTYVWRAARDYVGCRVAVADLEARRARRESVDERHIATRARDQHNG